MARLAYILAASHSGSTLLAMLLGAHPQACTAGELKATHLGDPIRYRCSCGSPIKECAFWARVSQVMQRKGFVFDVCAAGTDFSDVEDAYVRWLLRPLHRGSFMEFVRDRALSISPQWSRHRKRAGQRNVALVETLQEITGAEVVVDSSKTGLRLKYLLRERELDVSVIRLVRDGRGVSLAYMDPLRYADAVDPTLRAGGFGGSRENERRSIEAAAREWRRSNEEEECLVAALGRSRHIEVRYEVLCGDPDNTVRDIYVFLGLSAVPVAKSFRSAAQHVIGNGMRLDSSSGVCLDDRWKTSLTRQELGVFETVAGAMNRRYGYE